LKREHPDIVEALEAILQQWKKSMEENPGGWK
jgi:hypothetical protein